MIAPLLLLSTALLSALAHAEPNRATATFSAGVDGTVPAIHGAVDYGIIRHFAVEGEVGIGFRGAGTTGSIAGGLLILPVDGQWVRLGVAVMPELHDALGRPRAAARAGLRAGWLMFWGVGLQGRLDVVLPMAQAPELQGALGLSVRM